MMSCKITGLVTFISNVLERVVIQRLTIYKAAGDMLEYLVSLPCSGEGYNMTFH